MSKYIIDYLDKIDETLLEDALCIPEEPYEVALDSGSSRPRGLIMRTAAVAASLAAALTFVATVSVYSRGGFSPSQSGSSGSVSGGILIPTEFSQADLEAQRIVEEKYLSARNTNNDRFLCKSYENAYFSHFVFPQINTPLFSQDGPDIYREIVAAGYNDFLRNSAYHQFAQRKTYRKTDRSTDNGDSEIFHNIQSADGEIFDSDSFHNTYFAELLGYRKVDDKPQNNH